MRWRILGRTLIGSEGREIGSILEMRESLTTMDSSLYSLEQTISSSQYLIPSSSRPIEVLTGPFHRSCAGHRLGTSLLEQVVSSHPFVAECCVVGLPDELKGTSSPLRLSLVNL